MKEQIVLTINKLNPSAAASLIKLKQEVAFRVIVIRDVRVAPQDRSQIDLDNLVVSEMETDFFDDARLKFDIEPLRASVLGVVSRGESSIQYLARLSAICSDWELPLPTSDSLEIATDKQRMRQSFIEHSPELTPTYMRISDANESTMHLIDETVGYPLVIKPANLASSLLIQRCDTRQQAQQSITGALEVIGSMYDESGRHEDPVIIVEQMLEGDLYSVDAYVSDTGDIFCCPAVEYVTGQSVGVDDFFLYRRSAPTHLESSDWDACKLAVERGIKAIGLTTTTAHIELCKTNDGWKIIEIGPRVGRYRIEMYREVFGIEHSDNDIKIRLGLMPELLFETKAYCSVYSVYPYEEGMLEQIDNLDAVHGLESLKHLRRLIEDGTEVRYAKNGGHALAEVVLAHENRVQFEQDCAWFEANVKAKVKAV